MINFPTLSYSGFPRCWEEWEIQKCFFTLIFYSILLETLYSVCVVFFAFYCKTLQINPEWYLHKVVNWDWLLVVSRCSLFNLRVGGTFSRILWRCKITTLQTCDLCQKLPIIFVYNLERYTLHNMYLYLLNIYFII